MTAPLISIIVPCYNQAEYLNECLQSVLDQTYSDWECIIVNDGSQDDTEDVAKKWTKKDPRFKYLLKENGGLSSARNAGINMAKGEWILPLDSDDRIGVYYLELAAEQFAKDFKIIYCEAQYFGLKNLPWQIADYSLKSLAFQNIIFCSAFYRKKDWVVTGGYDEKLLHGWEDWDFWLNIQAADKEVYKIKKTLFYYRIKEHSMITDFTQDEEKVKNAKSYIFAKHKKLYHSVFGDYISLIGKLIFLEKENNYQKNYILKLQNTKVLKYYLSLRKLFT